MSEAAIRTPPSSGAPSRRAGQVDPSTTTMTGRAFDALRAIAVRESGIVLDDSRDAMLSGRLFKRLRALDLQDFDDYVSRVERDADELDAFLDAISTNLSYFFRESHHFDWLSSEHFPRLADDDPGRPVRIWSAGCSAGQEPYSIAITAQESGLAARRRVRILATDIHRELVPRVAAGRFAADALRGLSVERHARWFADDGDGHAVAARTLRESIIAKRLNLLDAWPIKGGVDLIVCRNTLIYFDADRRTRIVDGFARLQLPGAYLLLGHSESLRDHPAYARVESTVYRRR